MHKTQHCLSWKSGRAKVLVTMPDYPMQEPALAFLTMWKTCLGSHTWRKRKGCPCHIMGFLSIMFSLCRYSAYKSVFSDSVINEFEKYWQSSQGLVWDKGVDVGLKKPLINLQQCPSKYRGGKQLCECKSSSRIRPLGLQALPAVSVVW